MPGLHKPIGTIVADGQKHALVSAFLAKHYGGQYKGPGAPLDEAGAHRHTGYDHHALVVWRSAPAARLRCERIGSSLTLTRIRRSPPPAVAVTTRS